MRVSNDLSLRASLEHRPLGDSKLFAQQRPAGGTDCSGDVAAGSTGVPVQSERDDGDGSSMANKNERRPREPSDTSGVGADDGALAGGGSTVVSTPEIFHSMGPGSENGDGGGDDRADGGGAGSRDLRPPEQGVSSKENQKAIPSDGLHQLKQEILDLEGKILGRLGGSGGGAGGVVGGGKDRPPAENRGCYSKKSSEADQGSENRDARSGYSEGGNAQTRGTARAKPRKGSSARGKREGSASRVHSSSSYLLLPRSTAGGSAAASAHWRDEKSRGGETPRAVTVTASSSSRPGRTGTAVGRPPKVTATAPTGLRRGSGGSESCEYRSSVTSSQTREAVPRRPQPRGAPPSPAGAGSTSAGVGKRRRRLGDRPHAASDGRGISKSERDARGGRRRRRDGTAAAVATVAGEGVDRTSVSASSCPASAAPPCHTPSRGGSLPSEGGSRGETSSQGTGGGREPAFELYEPGTWPLSSVSDYANSRGLGRAVSSGGGGSSGPEESSEEWERGVLDSLTSRDRATLRAIT